MGGEMSKEEQQALILKIPHGEHNYSYILDMALGEFQHSNPSFKNIRIHDMDIKYVDNIFDSYGKVIEESYIVAVLKIRYYRDYKEI